MVPCAGLFRQKAEEGRTLDALPLLRREALKKARALWSLVWRVLVRCALESAREMCMCVARHPRLAAVDEVVPWGTYAELRWLEIW